MEDNVLHHATTSDDESDDETDNGEDDGDGDDTNDEEDDGDGEDRDGEDGDGEEEDVKHDDEDDDDESTETDTSHSASSEDSGHEGTDLLGGFLEKEGKGIALQKIMRNRDFKKKKSNEIPVEEKKQVDTDEQVEQISPDPKLEDLSTQTQTNLDILCQSIEADAKIRKLEEEVQAYKERERILLQQLEEINASKAR